MGYVGKKPADIIATAVDTTTGTFSGDLTVDTNTLYVDSANNRVGVGTVSPTHALTVQYNAGTTTAKFQNTNTSGTSIDSATLTLLSASRDASISITSNSSRVSVLNFGDEVNAARGRFIYDNADDSLQFQAAASEAMRITSGGNVGIGTNSPSQKLDVNGTIVASTTSSQGARIERNGTTGGANFDSVLASGSLHFRTGATERMRIDSSGRVGIGTTSMAEPLRVQSNSGTDFNPSSAAFNQALMLKNSTAGAANCVSLGMTTESNGEVYLSAVENSSNNAADFVISTRNSGARAERMRILSGGNVGIGTDSPAQLLHVQAGGSGNGVIRLGGNAGLEISHDNAGNTIQRIDSLYRTTANDTNLQLRTGTLTFHTGTSSTERMRIDSSGNLLVGKTSTAFGTEGIVIAPEYISATRDSGEPFVVNRTSTDGELIGLYRQSSKVGSIGTATRPYFASPDWGVKIGQSGAQGYLEPTNQSGSALDNGINIGASGTRWKDLYLSGGVYLGGTGSANKLDDYEEGTWTPGVSGRTFTSVFGSYTKVGNLVTVYFDANTMAGGDITNPSLTGLPFTSTNSSSFQYGGYLTIQEPYGIAGIYSYVYFRVSKNVTTGAMLQGGGNGSSITHASGVVMSNGDNFRGVGQYFSDA